MVQLIQIPVSVLFVLGFSFNDEHIEDITKRSLNNPSLIIIIFAYSKGARDNFNKKFEEFNNVMIVGLNEWDEEIIWSGTKKCIGRWIYKNKKSLSRYCW